MSLFSSSLLSAAQKILAEAEKKKLHIATAESCTGGLISSCLTETPGSSRVFDRGFVTYSNDAKMTNLNVSRKTLADFGAVSAEVALEMAEGALSASSADIAVSVTGVAGPDGGTNQKPVGLVYIGVSLRSNGDTQVSKNAFSGDRSAIRLQTVETVFKLLQEAIDAA